MLKRQHGAATLLLSVLLMSVITLIVLAASNYTWFFQKISSNQYRSSQAFEAAMAGLDYGVQYFNDNHGTITANTTNGYLDAYSDSNTTSTLSNGAQYQITYTNPIAYNYELILVTAQGVSDDGEASRTVSQLIQSASYLNTLPQVSLISKGDVSLKNTANIINTQTNKNILSGGAVSFENAAYTQTSGGVTSSVSSIGADTTANDVTLSGQTDSQLFETYFGVSPDNFKANATSYYKKSFNYDYSVSLAGKTGEIIWIDQTSGDASISAAVNVGSSTNPVILIVNGNLSLVGNAKIYGVIFVMGAVETQLTGTAQVIGSLISTVDLTLKNTAQIVYNTSVLNAIQSSMVYYAKVPGSWKDF